MITGVDILGDRRWSYAYAGTRRPIIKGLAVHHDGRLLDQDIQIFPRVTFEFPFDEPVAPVWEGNSRPIQAKGLNVDSISWERIDPQINYALIGRLLEPAVGSIRVQIINEETQEVIHETLQEMTMLARNEWISESTRDDLLAAFVLPSDPFVAEILTKAREILGRETGDSSTEGYQAERLPRPDETIPLQLRSRVFQIAQAIYEAMCEMGYSYSNPQGNINVDTQKIRTPLLIKQEKAATCLDSAVLMAACFAQAGLDPILVHTNGHAFAGFFTGAPLLTDGGFIVGSDAVATLLHNYPATCLTRGDDLGLIHRLLDEQHIQFVETTTTTTGLRKPFGDSCFQQNNFSRSYDQELESVILVSNAWRRGIRPAVALADESLVVNGVVPISIGADDQDQENGDLFDVDVELLDTALAGPDRAIPPRVRQWMATLLDLGGRNPLLKYKPAQCLEFDLPASSLGLIDDLLYTPKKRVAIVSPAALPKEWVHSGVTEGEFEQWTKKDLKLVSPSFSRLNGIQKFAEEEIKLLRGKPGDPIPVRDRRKAESIAEVRANRAHPIHTMSDATLIGTIRDGFLADLDSELTKSINKVQTKAKEVMLMTGNNSLYLVLGLMSWTQEATAGFARGGKQAKPTSWSAPLFLYPVIVEGGRGAPFTIRLDPNGEVTPNYCLHEKLKREPYNLDLRELVDPEYDEKGIDFVKVVAAIRKRLKQAKLDNFAIENRAILGVFDYSTFRLWKDLKDSWKQMAEISPVTRHLMYTSNSHYALNPPTPTPQLEPHLPIAADDSQREAVQRALNGESFRLEGPPGTGKSQTIANLLASCIAHNKKILFVAEKQTALNAVKERLDSAGLGKYCLNLHAKGDSDTRLRKNITESLNSVLAERIEPEEEKWRDLAARVKNEEAALDRYRNALHTLATSGFSVWKANEEAIKHGDGSSVSLPAGFVENYESNWSKLREIGFELENALENVGDPTTHRWKFVESVNVPESDLASLTAVLTEVLNSFSQVLEMGAPWSSLLDNPNPAHLRNLASALELKNEGKLPGLEVLHQIADEAKSKNSSGTWPRPIADRLATLIEKSRVVAAEVASHGKAVSAEILHQFNYEQIATLLAEVDQVSVDAGIIEIANSWNSFRTELNTLSSQSMVSLFEKNDLSLIEHALADYESTSIRAKFDEFAMNCRFLVTQVSQHLANVSPSFLGRNDFINIEFLVNEAENAGVLTKGKKFKALREALGEDAVAKDDRLLVLSLKGLIPLAGNATNLRHQLNTQFVTEFSEGFRPWMSADIDSLVASFNARRFNVLRDAVGLSVTEGDEAKFVHTLQATLALVPGLKRCMELLRHHRPDLEDSTFKPWIAGEVERLQQKAWRLKAAELRAAANQVVSSDDDLAMVAGIRAWVNVKNDVDEIVGSLAGNVLPGYEKSFSPWMADDIENLSKDFESLLRLAGDISDTNEFDTLDELLKNSGDIAKVHLLITAADAWAEFQKVLTMSSESIDGWLDGRTLGDAVVSDFPAMLREGGDHHRYIQLIRWQSLRQAILRLEDVGLRFFESKLLMNEVTVEEMQSQVRRSALAQALRMALEDGNLDRFDRKVHERRIATFQKAMSDSQEMLKTRIPGLVNQRRSSRALPTGNAIGGTQALLRGLSSGRGEKTPIRDLIYRYGNSLADAMPCFLMSPDSVATLVPVGSIDFDLIVFDEASQVRTAHAVGALGRGTAAIVVGDSRQMPPSSAFSSNSGTTVEDDGGLDDEEEILVDFEGLDDDILRRPTANKDEESILVEFKSSEFPAMQLLCHYRSKDEVLIAFSNTHIYPEPMLTFPSTKGLNSTALSFEYVTDGFFERDKKAPSHVFPKIKSTLSSLRTNRPEAERIVELVLSRLRDKERQRRFDNDSEGSAESIIVVTFNVQQMNLITELLREADLALFDVATKEGPKDEVTDKARPPRLKIRNLESVQGDEAELVIFSVAFSKTLDGKFPLNFGPVTNPGGDRRLNVAVTRAQREMKVFASFMPAEMSQGGKVLSDNAKLVQKFLILSAEGATRTADVGINVPRSSHIENIAQLLKGRGYMVQTQMGLSTLRVDLAVRRAVADDWELAIMVDDTCWSERGSAFQREVLPRQVLPNLGWKRVMRIWLPSWIGDSDEILEEIDSFFENIDSSVEEVVEMTDSELSDVGSLSVSDVVDSTVAAGGALPEHVSGNAPEVKFSPFTAFDPDSNRYVNRLDDLKYDESARQQVRAIILQVLAVEGPIEQTRLGKNVVKSMGLARVVPARIEEVLALVPDNQFVTDAVGTFVWPVGFDPSSWLGYRTSLGEIVRSANEISAREYANALSDIVENVRSIEVESAVKEIAEFFGFKRLTAQSREVIERALGQAVRGGRVTLSDGEYRIAVSPG